MTQAVSPPGASEQQRLLDVLRASEAAGRSTLTEPEAKAFLCTLGIPVPAGWMVASPKEAETIAVKLGRSVIVKVVSPDLTHKTDVGGVIGPVRTPEETGKAYESVVEAVARSRPDARIEGVLVEEFLENGIECALGMTMTTAFGPVVMFGLGGLFVEALRDVRFRLAPLLEQDALELVTEIRGAQCFEGIRGQPAVDKAALVATICRLSELARYPAVAVRIREFEINPLLATPGGVIALDALGILRRADA